MKESLPTTSRTSLKWKDRKSGLYIPKIPMNLPENLDSIGATIARMMLWDILLSIINKSFKILERKFSIKFIKVITQRSSPMDKQEPENLIQFKVNSLKKDYFRCACKPSLRRNNRTVEMVSQHLLKLHIFKFTMKN